MKGIVWLASYPKSGNTWFRTFLTNFLINGDKPVDINEIFTGPIASARQPFDEALGYDSGEMTFDEIDALRPEVYCHQTQQAKETLYCKIHDAYTFLPDGRPLIPPEATDAALYFIRNPLDVAVSFAHHGGPPNINWTIKRMENVQETFCDVDAAEMPQLRQKILSWSNHVKSWVEAPGIRVLPIRYEDMKNTPQETFTAAIRFAGLAQDPDRIAKAIRFSDFNEVRAQEQKSGFGEKLTQAKSFFRKGEIGSWREFLTPEQSDKIISRHAEMMHRFGYLDANNEPVF